MEDDREFTVFELFTGAGGLSSALHNSGWNLLAGVEIDKWSAKTFRFNFPDTELFEEDVRNVDFAQFRGIDLLVGGPPCQPFSVAGKQLAKDDDRDMVPEFLRAVREIQPKAFLMENVPGLLTQKHKPYLHELIFSFQKLGYSLDFKLLNAADYGVPQFRKRVFFVGTKENLRFTFPEAMHGPQTKVPYISVRRALADVPIDMPNAAKVTYAKKPIVRPSPWAGMLVNGKGRPINLEEPSRTVPASAGGNRTHIIDREGVLLDYHKHLISGGKPRKGVVENVRRLTIRESARLQSFPDEFIFLGPKTSQYSQIGNAVPPLLAKAILEGIKKTILNPDKGSPKYYQAPLLHLR